MPAKTCRLELTGAQLRVLHETLSVVLNDPYWFDSLGSSERDASTLARAHEQIMDTWRTACRAESTPAGSL